MGRFVNSETKVVVSVADDKDARFPAPLWAAYDGTESEQVDETGDGSPGTRQGRRGRSSTRPEQ